MISAEMVPSERFLGETRWRPLGSQNSRLEFCPYDGRKFLELCPPAKSWLYLVRIYWQDENNLLENNATVLVSTHFSPFADCSIPALSGRKITQTLSVASCLFFGAGLPLT